MLWRHYVFRRGDPVRDMWDRLFAGPPLRLLYIAGRGFDVRAVAVMTQFVESVRLSGVEIEEATLLLVGFTGYQLSDELKALTEVNAQQLEHLFGPLGKTKVISVEPGAEGEEDISASNALRIGTDSVLAHVGQQTHIVLDVSSLPRVAYLALITGMLQRLIPDKSIENPLWANGVTFQVLTAEDPQIDSGIRSEDPSDSLTLIPGFSSALHAETVQDWPLVWFPILGENRVGQLQKVLTVIPDTAEICPVLPHPSRNPRRGDELLVEYRQLLFDVRQTPITNVLYASEAHPFEAYRQMLGAMTRYRNSLKIVGGCRLVVTPLASKLITLGAALACFELRPTGLEEGYGVAIPYCEPTRYVAAVDQIRSANPTLSAMILTGDPYTR